MSAKLDIEVLRDGLIQICWFVDGDIGGPLGEEPTRYLKRKSLEEKYRRECEKGDDERIDEARDLLECAVADAAVVPFVVKASDGSPVVRGHDGFRFETMPLAKRALAAARLALKHIETPMPRWAIKAVAAGWKPPKGWKP